MDTTVRRKDYFWNTLGVFFQNITSPLLLLIVTRINGIHDSGLFSFAFAISLMLWSLAMWGGRTYQVSDTRSEFSVQGYVGTRLLLSVVVMLIAVGFSLVNNYPMYMTLLFAALTLFKVAESFADVLYGVLQASDKLYMSGISLAVKSFIGIAGFLLINLYTGSILYATLFVVAINFVILIVFDLRLAVRYENNLFSDFKIKKHIQEAFGIMKKTYGIFIVFFLALFSLNIPRYFIEKLSTEEVGYFGVIAMPITLIVLLITFILQPNIVQLSRMYSKGLYKQFSSIINKILLLSFSVGLVVLFVSAVFGPEILKIIFGMDFEDYRQALVIIVVGGIASALTTVYLNVYVIIRSMKAPLLVLLLTNIGLLIASYYIIRTGGVDAGVRLYMITNVIQLIALGLYYNFRMKRNLHAQKS